MGRFRQHPAVRAELRDASAWYENRAGLGADLLDKYDRAIDEIVKTPRTWPRWAAASTELEIRRFFVRPYPYYVPYLVAADGGVLVLAFAHEKRRPGYWLGRASSAKRGNR